MRLYLAKNPSLFYSIGYAAVTVKHDFFDFAHSDISDISIDCLRFFLFPLTMGSNSSEIKPAEICL